jgi:hypothetical protein
MKTRWLAVASLLAYFWWHPWSLSWPAGSYPPPQYFLASAKTPSGLTVAGDREVVVDRTDRTTPLVHVFQLHNPTSRPIQIKEVRCGCACMASKLDALDIPSDGTQLLTITIRAFDAYRSNYRENIVVKTSAGDLELWISGHLPLPDRVLFRPSIIQFDSLSDASAIERSIFIRVPKTCCGELSANSIEWCGSARPAMRLDEQAPSELYREFTLTISLPAHTAESATGRLLLNTGCGVVQVEVKPLPGKPS